MDFVRGDRLMGKCPRCGLALVVRQNHKLGNLFVGCSGYPGCLFARPIGPSDRRSDDQALSNLSDYPDSGMLCVVCRERQHETPSGLTCKNGHGGAGSIDPGTGEVIESADDADDLPGAPAAAAGGSRMVVSVSIVDEDGEDRDGQFTVEFDVAVARNRASAGLDAAAELVGRALPDLLRVVREVLR